MQQPWAIVMQDNKLFNSSSFRTANANSRALAGRVPKLSCFFFYQNNLHVFSINITKQNNKRI